MFERNRKRQAIHLCKIKNKARLKWLLMPPVGEAMDHEHFLTMLGESAVGLELAFLSDNLAIWQHHL